MTKALNSLNNLFKGRTNWSRERVFLLALRVQSTALCKWRKHANTAQPNEETSSPNLDKVAFGFLNPTSTCLRPTVTFLKNFEDSFLSVRENNRARLPFKTQCCPVELGDKTYSITAAREKNKQSR